MDLIAAVCIGVRRHRILQLRLQVGGQAVPGEARRGELGIAILARQHAGGQHRGERRRGLERAVGVPELVAAHEQCARVVPIEDAAVLIKIGDIEYLPGGYPPPAIGRTGLSSNVWLDLKWTIEPRKGY